MTSHVYFDFFGTLVDYDPSVLPDTANAPYDFAARAGAGISGAHASELWQRAWTELDTAAHASVRECSMLDIAGRYAELLGRAGFAIPSGGLDRLVSEYLEAWTTNIRLAAGVTDCLTDLARDHTLSVVSNTHDAGLVPRMLRRFGIADYFTNVFTSVELGWRKPHPEIFAAVLAEDAITADQAAFLGDNWEADVEGPQAAGMRAFYVGIPAPGRAPVEFCALPDLIRG